MNRPTEPRGFALMTIMLVMLVAAALATSAVMMGSNHILANRYLERSSMLEDLAEEGLEMGRTALNADKTLYPDSGYTTLVSGQTVYDGQGNAIPGVTRAIYAGPTGVTSGQYGVFGSIVAVVEDQTGAKAIRRSQVYQESFARYAYFTDFEPSNISFGGGDQIFGPVHTNDYLKIYSSGATFHGETRTAKTVSGASYGTFKKGYEEHVSEIAMPETAELAKLQTQASAGSMSFVGGQSGAYGESTFRIEFVAVDMNLDGDTNDENEGFIRVYSGGDYRWVTAEIPSAGMDDSPNCGDYHSGVFRSALDHPNSGHDWGDALTSSSRRCYLGGDPELTGGVFTPVSPGGRGEWQRWNGPVSPTLVARVGATEAQYLHPINRPLNPAFKGVIYVDGKVAISGTLRGRVTLAATEQIIIADDVVYSVDPGTGTCEDILGMFSGEDVIVADNTINAPQRPASGWGYRTYDDTRDEFIHGVVLALNIFTVENYSSGSGSAEDCESTNWGRGCLYLTGGIIQRTRGAVGTSGGTGNLKRYSYDTCGATDPPPYFPTTGHFSRAQIYNVDPVGFNVADYFAQLAAN
ncbi:hypothetical protein [Gaopeijia maritima]|uniref:Type 4 fimbrial biogenesis protein PilX N-terminal domain-containing protein n=1 Tax=Gaopeijia maritima TaxID=3119007 RepID=A0ABU9EAI6_9BACT